MHRLSDWLEWCGYLIGGQLSSGSLIAMATGWEQWAGLWHTVSNLQALILFIHAVLLDWLLLCPLRRSFFTICLCACEQIYKEEEHKGVCFNTQLNPLYWFQFLYDWGIRQQCLITAEMLIIVKYWKPTNSTFQNPRSFWIWHDGVNLGLQPRQCTIRSFFFNGFILSSSKRTEHRPVLLPEISRADLCCEYSHVDSGCTAYILPQAWCDLILQMRDETIETLVEFRQGTETTPEWDISRLQRHKHQRLTFI